VGGLVIGGQLAADAWGQFEPVEPEGGPSSELSLPLQSFKCGSSRRLPATPVQAPVLSCTAGSSRHRGKMSESPDSCPGLTSVRPDCLPNRILSPASHLINFSANSPSPYAILHIPKVHRYSLGR